MSTSTSLLSSPIVEIDSVYTIAGHGIMYFTRNAKRTLEQSNAGNNDNKYYAIDIPENVELYTYTELGQQLRCNFTAADYVCKPKRSVSKTLEDVITPAYKYFHRPGQGQSNKFPNLFFEGEMATNARFYSGITHCVNNEDGTNTSSVIYSMDAKTITNCNSDIIRIPGRGSSKYDYNKKYSKWYSDILKKENKCGPILLSEAIELIQKHSTETYKTKPNIRVTIKIYIQTCLEEKQVEITLKDTLSGLTQDSMSRMSRKKIEHYQERIKYNLKTKLMTSNIVDSKDEFSEPTTEYPSSKMLIKLKLDKTTFIIRKEPYSLQTRFEESKLAYFLQDCLAYAIDKYAIQYSSLPANVEIDLLSEIKLDNYRAIINEMYDKLKTLGLEVTASTSTIPTKLKRTDSIDGLDGYFLKYHLKPSGPSRQGGRYKRTKRIKRTKKIKRIKRTKKIKRITET